MNRSLPRMIVILSSLLLIPLALFFLEALGAFAIISSWILGNRLSGAAVTITGDLGSIGFTAVFASFGIFTLFGPGLFAFFRGTDYLGVDQTMRWSPRRIRLPHEDYERQQGGPADELPTRARQTSEPS